jgi:polysaccharide biosynthesis transport protein
MSDVPAGDRSPLDLRDYLGVLWRRLWIVLAVTAIVFGAGLIRSLRQPKIYQAQGQFAIVDTSKVTDLQTQLRVVASPVVHDLATRRAPGIGRVSSQQSGLGNIITVAADNTNPELAARTVNATIDAYAAYLQQQTNAQEASAATPIQRRLGELQKQIDAVNVQIAAVPLLPQLSAADSELTARRDGLMAEQLDLQQRLDNLRFDTSANGSGINVVARATVPTSPIQPNPRSDGLIALGAGLLLGLALAFAVEYLARSTGHSEKADQALPPQRALGDVTLMGVIPTATSSVGEVVALSAPESAAAQSYRSLHNVASLMGLERGRCLAVTSAPGRDGKTETLTNLAVLLARAGRRVVVVDCDLRTPRVHEFFGLTNEIGFTSVMRGAPLADALQRVPNVGHLYALTSGPLPADPDEMLTSSRCVDVFSSLVVGGTLVLVDTPPLLPSTDTLTLTRTVLVDGIVLVASPRTDESEHLRQALDALQRTAVQQVGVVLTGPDTASEEQPVDSVHRPLWASRRNGRHANDNVEAWNGLMRADG